MSKTLPPKINLHEGRERRREKRRVGRRRKGKSLSTGTEGKESPFQWNKNCAISLRTACSDRGGPVLSRKWISVVFLDNQGIRAHCNPRCLGGYRSWRFLPDGLQRRKRAVQSFQKGDMTVQRCKISDESIRHALPMGERINIFSAWTVIYLRVQCSPCRRLHLNALWMLNGVSCFFGRGLLGGCVIRGWERRWTALQIFHYSTVLTARVSTVTSPEDFGLHIEGKHNAYDSIRHTY